MFGRGRRSGRRAGVVLAGGSSGVAAVVPFSFFPASRERFPVTVPPVAFNPSHRFRLGGGLVCQAKKRVAGAACIHIFTAFSYAFVWKPGFRAYLVLHTRPLLDSMMTHLPQQCVG
ncbi:hypothetical protein MRX96_031021 [Rhipicephalus microplus]